MNYGKGLLWILAIVLAGAFLYRFGAVLLFFVALWYAFRPRSGVYRITKIK
jgi:uncharacterized membrane protein